MNDNILEKDIERLSNEIKNFSPEKPVPREAVKEALRPMVNPAPQVSSSSSARADEVENEILPAYLKDSSPEIKLKVEQLIGEIFQKGIEKASADAAKFGPFVLDAFHDALTDKLYGELKKRNII